MVNLSIKLDGLTNQISQLLNLFEVSAKSLAEKNPVLGGNYEKRLIEKIDGLVDQNKTIARGIALLHEPPQDLPSQRDTPQESSKQDGLPERFPQHGDYNKNNIRDYQKSLSSKNQKFNQLTKS